MSNTSFRNIKTTRKPFSSLNTREGNITGVINNPIFVLGNVLPGDNPSKVIELFGSELNNVLIDSSGNEWKADENIEVIGAEFSVTNVGTTSTSVALKTDRGGSTVHTIIDSTIGIDETKVMKASLFHSKPLASNGTPTITFIKGDKMYVSLHGGEEGGILMNVKVKLYYRSLHTSETTNVVGSNEDINVQGLVDEINLDLVDEINLDLNVDDIGGVLLP